MSHPCENCKSAIPHTPKDDHPAYLICPACSALTLTYQPQDYQNQIHEVPIQMVWNPKKRKLESAVQVVGVFGGYGSGKSRASLQEVFIRALESPNGTGLLTAPTLAQLKKTTLKMFFNEICPPPLIEHYNKTDMEIRLINGFTFYVVPTDDETKIRSINAGIVHMEEASGIRRTIFDQILTRMRDPFTPNRLVMVCSNPDLGWIRDVFWENLQKQDPDHPNHDEYNPFITTCIWPTHLNTHLPPDFIEMNRRGKPEWWVKRYLEGSFDFAEGAVYPHFMSTVIPQPENWAEISKKWEKFVGHDHGIRNATVFLYGAIDPVKGEVHIYDEYYVTNKLVPHHAAVNKPKIDAIPHGLLRFMVTDPANKNRADPVTGKSVQAIYQEYGLFFTLGNNSLEAGLAKVNNYIELGRLKIHSNCVQTIKEGLNYKYPELTNDQDKNLDERPIKHNDHACFVAGTLIDTNIGQVPIEDITIGNYALTRKGYRKIVGWSVTDRQAETYTVHFSNGVTLTATGNHPVWVEGKGFRPMDSLRYGDIVKVSHNWEESEWSKQLYTKDTSIEDTQMQRMALIDVTSNVTIMGKWSICIMWSTKIATERFQRAVTFIIKMAIQLITTLRTWKQNWLPSIYPNMVKSENTTGNTLNEYGLLLKNGIVQKKGLNGIGNTQSVWQKIWKNVNILAKIVTRYSAKNRLVQTSSATTTVEQLGGESLESITYKKVANGVEGVLYQTNMTENVSVPESVRVVGLQKTGNREVVYNITVEDAHEYFANGVLVHNCDALRYALMRLPDDPDMLKAESVSPPRSYPRQLNESEWHDWRNAEEDDDSSLHGLLVGDWTDFY